MLEHSMRQKEDWKDIEATIHCAEWLSIIGGSSTGEQRTRTGLLELGGCTLCTYIYGFWFYLAWVSWKRLQ